MYDNVIKCQNIHPTSFYVLANKIIFQYTIKVDNNFCKESILLHMRKICLSDEMFNQITS